MLRLGIDAGNFARDRRGMGRVARDVALAALADPGFAVTFLLERRSDEDALRTVFVGHTIEVASATGAHDNARYDAVWFPWNGMRFAAAAPTLVTIHDAFAFTYPNRGFVARWREQWPIRRGARRGTRLVTGSQWSRAEIARMLEIEPARLTVVPNVPDALFVPGEDAPPFDGAPYALLVGAGEERKNARLAIEACAGAFYGEDRLAIVGGLTAPDAAALRESRVRRELLGSVEDLGLRRLYRHARAVLVPSFAEGFGLVAVEAMACGAPTLAANAAALPEATRGGALLLDPHDVTAWRDAVARAMHDDAFAAELGARGAATFAGADRAAPAKAYVRLFRETASG